MCIYVYMYMYILKVQGFKRVLWPNYYNLNGIWDLKPMYLGPWTFRDICIIPASFSLLGLGISA